MKVKPSQLKELLTDALLAGVVPMVSSSPGMGKSSIAQQIADEYDLELIDIRLAQCDPTELNKTH
jgi:MoxR-like ATPase